VSAGSSASVTPPVMDAFTDLDQSLGTTREMFVPLVRRPSTD
jgi:hypothetical protein